MSSSLKPRSGDDPQAGRGALGLKPDVGAGKFSACPRTDRLRPIFQKKLLEEKNRRARAAMKAPPKKIRARWRGERRQDRRDRQRTSQRDAAQRRRRHGHGRRKPLSSHRPPAGMRPPLRIGAAKSPGRPQLFVLKTVNVIAAGKTVIVLDKSNKKLWQATLTYPVGGGGWESLFREKIKIRRRPVRGTRRYALCFRPGCF